MKVFISADIEGVAGITSRDESTKGQSGYPAFRAQMDREVAAACEGAFTAGADEIVVKDAHGDGRNLSPAALPAPAALIRGYNGHPYAMVQGLDETFDAVAAVGYHSRAGSGGNPLSHTLSGKKVVEIRLDGEPVSELGIHARAAGMLGVPVVFVAGDRALCDEAAKAMPGCGTFATFEGTGASTTGVHPDDAVAGIRSGITEALLAARPEPVPMNPPHRLEVTFFDPSAAYVRGFYPGAERIDDRTMAVTTDDYFEVLRALVFLVGI